jgi:hypothetical protein
VTDISSQRRPRPRRTTALCASASLGITLNPRLQSCDGSTEVGDTSGRSSGPGRTRRGPACVGLAFAIAAGHGGGRESGELEIQHGTAERKRRNDCVYRLCLRLLGPVDPFIAVPPRCPVASWLFLTVLSWWRLAHRLPQPKRSEIRPLDEDSNDPGPDQAVPASSSRGPSSVSVGRSAGRSVELTTGRGAA